MQPLNVWKRDIPKHIKRGKVYDAIFEDGIVLKSCIVAENRKWAKILGRASFSRKVRIVCSKTNNICEANRIYNEIN